MDRGRALVRVIPERFGTVSVTSLTIHSFRHRRPELAVSTASIVQAPAIEDDVQCLFPCFQANKLPQFAQKLIRKRMGPFHPQLDSTRTLS